MPNGGAWQGRKSNQNKNMKKQQIQTDLYPTITVTQSNLINSALHSLGRRPIHDLAKQLGVTPKKTKEETISQIMPVIRESKLKLTLTLQ